MRSLGAYLVPAVCAVRRAVDSRFLLSRVAFTCYPLFATGFACWRVSFDPGLLGDSSRAANAEWSDRVARRQSGGPGPSPAQAAYQHFSLGHSADDVVSTSLFSK